MRHSIAFALTGLPCFAAFAVSAAHAEELQEIVVTAQKREQSIQDVGMSINAISEQRLKDLGVGSTADLVKVVPGLTATPPNAGNPGAPIYTLRGVGFNEASLSALSAVSVYLDEVPLSYSWMTAGPSLDVQRVEVLKGPQGTLFGQNSTGGAINFISNKPTPDFQAGDQVSYGRFNSVDTEGFVSGPLAAGLEGRAAVRFVRADGWQESITRPGDTLGGVNQLAARVLLNWTPTDGLRLQLNLNGWRDRSQSLGAQLIGYNPYISFSNPPFIYSKQLFAIPLSPTDNRAADWTPGLDLRNDNKFGQASLRAEWDVSDKITLTSISAYSALNIRTLNDADGSAIDYTEYGTAGDIHSFDQELRLTGSSWDKFNWIGGLNYSKDTINESQAVLSRFGGPGVFLGITGTNPDNHTERTTKAVFASGDYDLTPTINVQAGARYTKVNLNFYGCAKDLGDGTFARLIDSLAGGTAGPGDCVTYLNASGQQGLVYQSQNENNVSWRVGTSWRPNHEVLLYGNVSRGFKGGDFPTLTGLSAEQYNPVKQEQLTAYEVGFKTTFDQPTMQIDGAVFHYDYKNKQLYAYITTVVGLGEATVNIPKSKVDGAELQVTLRPVEGLTLNAGVAYTRSEIGANSPLQVAGFTSTTWPPPAGFVTMGTVNVSGDPFNLAPKLQGSTDGEYAWSVGHGMKAFFGGSTLSSSWTLPLIGASYSARLPGYTTIDLRAGVASSNGKWRVTLWGRNVTNKLYDTAVARTFDVTGRFVGLPATYGITVANSF
jgi:iron complex outermembrane receptor protein